MPLLQRLKGDVPLKQLCLRLMVLLLLMEWAIPASAAQKPSVLLVLGDSISTGFSPNGTKGVGFADLLAAQNGYTLKNAAKNGNTAADVLAQLKAAPSLLEDADIITITCGGNELLQALYRSLRETMALLVPEKTLSNSDLKEIMARPDHPLFSSLMLCATIICPDFDRSEYFTEALENWRVSLHTLASYIHRNNAEARLLIAAPYNPYEHFDGVFGTLIGTAAKRTLEQMRRILLKYQTADAYRAVDLYTAFSGRTAALCNASEHPLQPDVHPNAAGHQVIADYFATAINRPKKWRRAVYPLLFLFGAAAILQNADRRKNPQKIPPEMLGKI